MQSAVKSAAIGNHHRNAPEVYSPQKIANAPKAEKFSGKGANLNARVNTIRSTAIAPR